MSALKILLCRLDAGGKRQVSRSISVCHCSRNTTIPPPCMVLKAEKTEVGHDPAKMFRNDKACINM
jgi:hypothetical protein